METFLEILKYTVPALIVLIASFIIIRAFLENETRKQELKVKLSNSKTLIPIKMQAYERLVLYLERIIPNNLIIRVSRPDMNSMQLKAALIVNIREEFEHNMSQQLYISEKAWEVINNTKEEMIRLVNTSSSKVGETKSGQELAGAILEAYITNKDDQVKQALQYLKEEFNEAFTI